MFKNLTAISRVLFASKKSKHSSYLPIKSVFTVSKLVSHCLVNLKNQASGHATWQKLPCGKMLQMWSLKHNHQTQVRFTINDKHKCPSPLHQIRPLVDLMMKIYIRKIYGIPVIYNHGSVKRYLNGLMNAQLPENKAGMQFIFFVISRNKITMIREKKKRIEKMKLCLPPCQFNKIQDIAKECGKNKKNVQNGKYFSRKDYCEL